MWKNSLMYYVQVELLLTSIPSLSVCSLFLSSTVVAGIQQCMIVQLSRSDKSFVIKVLLYFFILHFFIPLTPFLISSQIFSMDENHIHFKFILCLPPHMKNSHRACLPISSYSSRFHSQEGIAAP